MAIFNGKELNENNQKPAIYKGFSSKNFILTSKFKDEPSSFSITDIDVVKEDLFNHIYTAHGERVHMPDFGTRIPLMTFEPNDQNTVNIIEEDLKTVFNYDPRVELLELIMLPFPDNNAIVASCKVKYVELDIIEELKLQFNTL